MWKNWESEGLEIFYYVLDILFKRKVEDKLDIAIVEMAEK